MSVATDIIIAIKDQIDTDKSIISEVYTDYTSMEELLDIAKTNDSLLPAAFVFPLLEELKAESVLDKDQRRTRLPIAIDIYGVRIDNALTEQEEALKEVRDIIELPANKTWSQPESACVITEEPTKIIRSTPFSHSALPDTIIWACSVQFDVLYTHILGNA